MLLGNVILRIIHSCVVIIFLNKGLHKSAFPTYSFGKLAFCLPALVAFFDYSVSHSMKSSYTL